MLNPIDAQAYPLTPQQKGLWFEHKLNPQSIEYNTYSQLSMKKGLDLERFKKAIFLVYNFFPVGRTAYSDNELGQGIQVIAPFIEQNPIEFEDISTFHNMDAEAKYQLARTKVAQKQSDSFFNLATGYRVYLIKYSEEGYIFTGIHHHISMDGLSGLLALEAIVLAYNSGINALQDRFKEVLNVGDYLKEVEASQDQISLSKAYWQTRLTNAKLTLDIPGRSSRFEMQQVKFSLGNARYDLVKKLAKQNKTTPFLVLSALYAVLLYRYFGQKEFMIGYPVNLRPKGFKEILGHYVSIYPIKIDINGQDSFEDLIKTLTAEQKQDRQHLNLSMDQLIHLMDRSDPHSHENFNISIGQAMFVHSFLPPMENVEFETELGTGLENKDLSLLFDPQTEALDCKLAYNAVLFTEAMISALIENFTGLIDSVSAQESPLAIDTIDYLGSEQKTQLLTTFNNTKADYPKDKCIHQLFTEQAQKSPDQIAVMFEDQTLTYQELDQKSTNLALYLQSLGVKPDQLIGIQTERSLEMIIGLLGILKSGGAYVPLDPTYPQDRLNYMIQDSGIEIILTEELIKTGMDFTFNQPLKEAVSSQNLAYIIYTSGSTGKPKGVMIEHRNAVAMIAWAHSVFSAKELECVLASTSYTFDLSVFEMFVPLTVGGAIVIVKNALALTDSTEKHPLTLINTVPSAIAALIEAEAIPQTVQTINLAGEPLKQPLVETVYNLSHVQKVYDLYGPSEDTTYSTFALRKPGGKATIGIPISNTKAYILDQNQQLLPLGIPGELHLSGAGLARGYLNQPDLTAEKFIENPFIDKSAIYQKMYKTGDLARWNPDGTLAYLGRLDNQVKIRGFRIEIGEIEAVLNQHPEIQNAVVIAQEAEGHNKLVCFYVSANGSSSDTETLKTHLKQKLPDYMIPSGFEMIEAIPLTPTGKIDRKKLEQQTVKWNSQQGYTAPRNQTEETVVQIFTEVLGLNPDQKIGIHDNFFELGGDSLLTIQVVTQVNQNWDIPFNVADFFQALTPAQLGAFITGKLENRSHTTSIQMLEEVKGLTTRYPVSVLQKNMARFCFQNPKDCTFNALAVIEIQGTLNETCLQRSFEVLVQRHAILRTCIQKVGEDYFNVEGEASPIRMGSQKRPDLSYPELCELMQTWIETPMDLEAGPLFRLEWIETSETSHYLVVLAHHIITDGASLGLIMLEFFENYERLLQGLSLNTSSPKGTYFDFVEWQRLRMLSPSYLMDKKYWAQVVQESWAPLNLPYDYPSVLGEVGTGALCLGKLSATLTTELKKLAMGHGVKVFSVLLTVFQVLLTQITGQRDFCIGTVYMGRTKKEFHDVLGCFIDFMVVKNVATHSEKSFGALFKEIEALMNQYLSQGTFPNFSMAPQDYLKQFPFGQVVFVFQNWYKPQPLKGELELILKPEFSQKHSRDLTISIIQSQGEFNLIFQYNKKVFQEKTVRRILDQYVSLLTQCVDF